MPGAVLMIQGTSSSAGKSLLTAALCRIYSRRGWRVAPFKAQNMSNNAAVCADGSEIGRAQAMQAAAAGIDPTADMNPILLKPQGNTISQVIVEGRVWRTLSARQFYQSRQELWPIVTAALDRLRNHFDLVIIEGAGSPVELNLKSGDMVNMALAKQAGAPVLLVGDIDRGGIFAQLLGTLWLLEPAEREQIRGLVVNKFRGDPALFADGIDILEKRGGVPVLGIIPFLANLHLPEEDAVALDNGLRSDSSFILHPSSFPPLDLAIIRLPHIANFDDFDPLAREPGVRLRYVSSLASLENPRAIILPGTKSTLADLGWLRAQGLDRAIREKASAGVPVAGICGGYQIMGTRILDPDRLESDEGEVGGLDLLPVETIFVPDKATFQVKARITGGPEWLAGFQNAGLTGYEIHMGRTLPARPWLEIVQRNNRPVSIMEGSWSAGGTMWGCYLHGLFANDSFRRAWLESLRKGEKDDGSCSPAAIHPPPQDTALDCLAGAVEQALDLGRLDRIIQQATVRIRP